MEKTPPKRSAERQTTQVKFKFSLTERRRKKWPREWPNEAHCPRFCIYPSAHLPVISLGLCPRARASIFFSISGVFHACHRVRFTTRFFSTWRSVKCSRFQSSSNQWRWIYRVMDSFSDFKLSLRESCSRGEAFPAQGASFFQISRHARHFLAWTNRTYVLRHLEGLPGPSHGLFSIAF